MYSHVQYSAARPGRPLIQARHKAGVLQQELAVAGAELELTNAILDRTLPESVKRSGEIGQALAQNGAIEIKVQEAADELEAVNHLLDEEVAERERLERELARRTSS